MRIRKNANRKAETKSGNIPQELKDLLPGLFSE